MCGQKAWIRIIWRKNPRFIREHGKITRTEAANLCQLNGPQTKRVLQKLTIKDPQFRLFGEQRGSYYNWDESM
jgi:hypothetical protein